MDLQATSTGALDLQIRTQPVLSEWQTINFRKLRHTLSSSMYTSFAQWTTGNLKSVARHLRTLEFTLRAPDQEATVSVVVEYLDRGSTYIPYSIDDCAIFMASTPAQSTEEPRYDVGSDGKPGNHRWQRSSITVKGLTNIYCCFGFRIANKSTRIRVIAALGDLRSESVLCVAVSGGSTQSVEQSRKRQMPNNFGSALSKRSLKRSPSPPIQTLQLPTVSMQEGLVPLQKLIRCGQWHEFDSNIAMLRNLSPGPRGLHAQILLSSRYMYTSTPTELADPHHPAWREFTKADRVLQEPNESSEVRYLLHLLTLYRKARLPFVGQHQWGFDRLQNLLSHGQISPLDMAAGYFSLALAPSPNIDENTRVMWLQCAIKIFCELNHPDDLARTVTAVCSVRMSRKPREGFVASDPLTHIPPGPWQVIGPEYEQVCCDLRQLNHKVMSLLTQTDYWLVWADVLLRGGRVSLATQMCLHCIKVAESVQPPFVAKVLAAKERLNILRAVSGSTPQQHAGAIIPAALLVELGLSSGEGGKKPHPHSHAQHAASTSSAPQTPPPTSHPPHGSHGGHPHAHGHAHAHQHSQHAHQHGNSQSQHAGAHAHAHNHTSSHQPHLPADPHGHLHSGHVHAELHAHSGHVHSHHTHGKGVAAVISKPMGLTHANYTNTPCSHSSGDVLGVCAPCITEKAPVCLEEIHCDGECCELLDWEIQLASCCCAQSSQHDA